MTTPTRDTLVKTVADRITKIAPDVQQQVEDAMVAKETARRVDVISKGLGELDSMQREKYKLDKPENVTYNADGSVASETFSKERIEARKKHDQKMEKLERAIDKALGGDMGDLYNIVK